MESPKVLKDKSAAAKRVEKWETLDVDLKKILYESGLDKFKKKEQPPTHTITFRKSIAKFTTLYFPPHLSFKVFQDRLALAKDHDDVNEVCLNYAATGAIISRTDCSNDIPSPIDTFPKETFFPQTIIRNEHGSDYQVP